MLNQRAVSAVSKDPIGLMVDPHFELYSGLDEGKPEPVPLEILLYEETPAFEHYIKRENLVYSERFRPAPGRAGVIAGLPTNAYETLRDWCSLRSPQHLNHALIFQVDEFWDPSGRAFRKQDRYLDSETIDENGRAVWPVDPFGLFQVSEAMAGSNARPESRSWWKRYEFFQSFGYELREKDLSNIDRIPFTWDFGFLLCRERCWIKAHSETLTLKGNNGEPISVGHVWNAMHKVPSSVGWKARGHSKLHRADVDGVEGALDGAKKHVTSWRAFLEACQIVARVRGSKASASVPAFDLSLLTPESFSCLVLEMWASGIVRHDPTLFSQVSRKLWGSGPNESLIKWLVGDSAKGNIQDDCQRWLNGQEKTPRGSWIELYKVWILLAEVLNLGDFVEPAQSWEFKPREGNASAVAVRHWYKTAAALSDAFDPSDPVLPCRLPGSFSARGDWFLAVLSGSLSDRLADQALDLLSSKRANRIRLQLGLGLPTRFPNARKGGPLVPNELGRVKLFKCGDHGERERATYQDMIDIGEDTTSEFHWLWRSRLRDYDRHARVFQRWMGRTLLFWNRLRYDLGREWISGFKIYDLIEEENFRELSNVESVQMFATRCDFLLSELRDATLASSE